MKVWVVMCGDCEGSYLVSICATKERALKDLFSKRDTLVKEYEEMLDMDKEMYQRMIDGLSGEDPEKWKNYPHELPYMFEQEVNP